MGLALVALVVVLVALVIQRAEDVAQTRASLLITHAIPIDGRTARIISFTRCLFYSEKVMLIRLGLIHLIEKEFDAFGFHIVSFHKSAVCTIVSNFFAIITSVQLIKTEVTVGDLH